MEFNDYTKIIVNRIQNFEPDTEKAIKIAGYLFFKYPEQVMSYAFGTDEQIDSLINEAKAYFSMSCPCFPPRTISGPFSPPSSFQVSALHLPAHRPTDFVHSPYNRILQSQAELANIGEQLPAINSLGLDYSGNYLYPDGSITGLRSPPNLPEFHPKLCYFFFTGHCERGNDCKYIHGQTSPSSFSYDPKEFTVDDHSFYLGSLEQLEVKIIELLKECKGKPVSIASLPSIYLEKYGKTIQDEGYLTVSQRHWKAGLSLTELLARLNSIRLIYRPHGQHAVVLTEDALKYSYKDDRHESGAVTPSSHQIYLTFKADSSFTDEDVLNYFKQFGPVREVRIPPQEERMFGFVSFHNAATVITILAMKRRHHICGSSVLVKPYKEKTRMWDRNYIESAEFPMYYHSKHFGTGPEIQSSTRGHINSCLPRKQPMSEDKLALELERKRILGQQTYFDNVAEDLNAPAEHFSPLGATPSDDQGSDDVELPESPFSF